MHIIIQISPGDRTISSYELYAYKKADNMAWLLHNDVSVNKET
jgi:hypothetical protein